MILGFRRLCQLFFSCGTAKIFQIDHRIFALGEIAFPVNSPFSRSIIMLERFHDVRTYAFVVCGDPVPIFAETNQFSIGEERLQLEEMA